jgi:two-component system, cell cycle sensor histidine kinase and response regulator CckA
MRPEPLFFAEAAALRHRVEARLRAQGLDTGPARSDADRLRLLQELQIHQIELEMQNEELRHARDEVEAGLAKYSDLYDLAPVGYLTLDREGTIREANLTCAGLLGVERAQSVGRRLESFISAEDRPGFRGFLTKIFEGRAKESREVTLLRADHPPMPVMIEAVATVSGRECRAALADVTEQHRAQADRLLARKCEAVEILLGGLATDYGNLLATMLPNLELARTLVPPGEEFLARRLQEAEWAALQAQELTRRLHALARERVLVSLPTSLPGVIRASVEAALHGVPVRGAFSVAEDLWSVDADARQLGQALGNVVRNAREATPRGGVISVRAQNVRLQTPGDASLPPGAYVRISIADHGVGMPRDVLPRIFDAYYSTKARGKDQGVGLGLTISQAIIRKHGGAITVESAVGVGTTVHLFLPATPGPEDAGPQARATTG